jgi:hypothetical protein
MHDKMDWYKIQELHFRDYVECLAPLYKVLEEHTASTNQTDIFLKRSYLAFTGKTEKDWESEQKQISFHRLLSMKMGDFHEELMGKLPAYETLPQKHSSKCDVRSKDETEYIEVKNNDNTMNSDSAKSVIGKLFDMIQKGKHAILILVNSLSPTTPRFGAHPEIEVMNGKKGYAHLSGREDFYDDLLETLDYTFKNFKTYRQLQEIA